MSKRKIKKLMSKQCLKNTHQCDITYVNDTMYNTYCNVRIRNTIRLYKDLAKKSITTLSN